MDTGRSHLSGLICGITSMDSSATDIENIPGIESEIQFEILHNSFIFKMV